ncbi:uncharacterized protein BO80DRAFT_452026 [Aspergillus ibericus CBS 121593]|uniref:Cryptococcal mannosyltransferase 1 n=1 Tax=Aspergillus ibericus CBS 121593 TaxID=1448316 RepID=A0A395HDB5_9EURO|nr:hypothetical protein BO80DRAFT_452026 [Aspergillus ibericus CBS 121593]RAL05095.1 hypothetical protein BO80DRAFT_452026 [Aspergillus ibericus CBS 121593]
MTSGFYYPDESRRAPLWSRLFSSTYAGYRHLKPSSSRRPGRYRRFLVRRICHYLYAVVGIVLTLVALTSFFRPSYSRPPPHYLSLRDAVSQSTEPGRGNPRHEKVFIAASLYDHTGELARGHWGDSVVRLIELLGPDNVFLSIYENDSGPEGENALRELAERVTCRKAIVFEEHLDLAGLPTVAVPGGSRRIKRIEYLAEVRNRALRPLDDHPEVRYDRLLYLNDVAFHPLDALQLLFSTNAAEDGTAQYRAACAVDFINPFKFYDTMGLPFFPWFSSAGHGLSRQDVLAGKDAVRVRSCWGGMVAFDATFFQRGAKSPTAGVQALGYEEGTSPARFRASRDTFWEASECCLIHADIQKPQTDVEEITDTGIYLNPYVRVAYDSGTLSWLGTTRRFEKLYSLLHNIIDHLVGLPWFNPRRTKVPGQTAQEIVWIPDEHDDGNGSFQPVNRIAGTDGFCGRRGLQVIVEHRLEGQKDSVGYGVSHLDIEYHNSKRNLPDLCHPDCMHPSHSLAMCPPVTVGEHYAEGVDLTKRITHIICGVIEAFMDRSSAGLEESRYAPKAEARGQAHLNAPQRRSGNQPASFTAVNPSYAYGTSTSAASSPSRLPPPVHNLTSSSSVCPSSLKSSSPSTSVKAMPVKAPPVANVDDTVGFMAAARTFKLSQSYGSPAVVSAVDASSEQGSLSKSRAGSTVDAFDHESTVLRDDAFAPGDFDNHSGVNVETPKAEEASSVTGDLTSQNDTPVTTTSAHPVGSDAVTPANVDEQDRTHLATFQSWGTPAVRDKPAAQVRRIIIKKLPPAWCNPAKVLSLVHGGAIQSINVTDKGTAHILFCSPEACQAFHEQYPEKINIDRERALTVSVEMGKDVDVVSSQLEFYLSVGSTRAVRAVGVDMETSMGQLYKIASDNGRKVEKIVDVFVPGVTRSVVFRFCSIEDAVRFRSVLVRHADWEQCNVQYAPDPCELATGLHVD